MGYVLVRSLIILGFQEEAAAPHRIDYPPGEVSEMVPERSHQYPHAEVIDAPRQKSSILPDRSHRCPLKNHFAPSRIRTFPDLAGPELRQRSQPHLDLGCLITKGTLVLLYSKSSI